MVNSTTSAKTEHYHINHELQGLILRETWSDRVIKISHAMWGVVHLMENLEHKRQQEG